MADRPSGQYNSGSHFGQQGQHVYGPQYNAEGIHINQADPQSVADGLAWDRQRRKAEQDAIRRRHEQAKAAADHATVRLAVIIVAAALGLMVLSSTVISILDG